MANMSNGGAALQSTIRRAAREDAAAIQHLLRESPYTHVHVDWRMPGDWLGEPGFLVTVRLSDRSGRFDRFLARPAIATSCLAVAADPPPAAWVRVAAVSRHDGLPELQALFDRLLEALPQDIDEIAWFLTDAWPEAWFLALGFLRATDVITYRKDDLTLPPVAEVPGLSLRTVMPEDMPALERMEADAFEPRWRHSADGLQRAAAQSVSFDVAELDGVPAGFQFSTRGRYGAHLARMTVARELQGRGIGAVLLREAILGYRSRGLHHVTLNTQSENFASQKLYTRFGFELSGPSFPVWTRPWPGR